MACISPLSLPRPGGNGPADRHEVPCGKCVNCLSKNRQDWSFRLKKELKASSSAIFLTLTYLDEFLPMSKTGKPEVSKIDVQLFLKRLRRRCPGVKVRYYLVSEYGPETKRPHYHGIFFNLPYTEKGNEKKLNDLITDAWSQEKDGIRQSMAFIKIGTVTGASIGYVTKYLITKNDEFEGREKVFSLMSRNPALGSNYLKSAYVWHKPENGDNRFYAIGEDGQKIGLPRYYRDKIFSPLEKERENSAVKVAQSAKAVEEFDQLIARGENPFLNELEGKNQLIERIKKRITKNSKL